MPFRPHTLAYRIRRLTDAGILTADQIATACGITRSTIDRIMTGATPSRQTEHSIIRVLSYHARRLHLKLEPELEEEIAPAQESPPRGVYEDTESFTGTNAFNVYRGDGTRIGRWEAPAGITDDELLDAFEGLIERKDADRLTMLPSSGEAS